MLQGIYLAASYSESLVPSVSRAFVSISRAASSGGRRHARQILPRPGVYQELWEPYSGIGRQLPLLTRQSELLGRAVSLLLSCLVLPEMLRVFLQASEQACRVEVREPSSRPHSDVCHGSPG